VPSPVPGSEAVVGLLMRGVEVLVFRPVFLSPLVMGRRNRSRQQESGNREHRKGHRRPSSFHTIISFICFNPE
jgi:hypothetical protein